MSYILNLEVFSPGHKISQCTWCNEIVVVGGVDKVLHVCQRSHFRGDNGAGIIRGIMYACENEPIDKPCVSEY